MKIKHHSLFKNLETNNIDWNHLRNDYDEEHYFIPKDLNQYSDVCKKDKYGIDELSDQLINNNIEKIFSIGSGRACQEYFLVKKNFQVTVSDISNSILNLKKFNIFYNVINKDFFESIHQIDDIQTALLLGRIDTELTDELLEKLFKQIHLKKIKFIVFIPAQVLTFKSFFMEYYIRIKSIFLNKKLIFCGYTRSFSILEKFWSDFYNTQKFKGFYLLIRK